MTGFVATRRAALAGLLAAAGGPLLAAPTLPERDDMVLGRPGAPVTVVEYASVGCPHCAKWSNEVFPAFKKKYVDTGEVRYVMRECLTGDADLAAAGFLLARCAGPSQYFPVVEEIFRRQPELVQSGAALRQVAADNGVDGAAFTACLSSQTALADLNARSQRHADVDLVVSTPTFVIGDHRVEGYMTLDQIGAAIAAARRGG